MKDNVELLRSSEDEVGFLYPELRLSPCTGLSLVFHLPVKENGSSLLYPELRLSPCTGLSLVFHLPEKENSASLFCPELHKYAQDYHLLNLRTFLYPLPADSNKPEYKFFKPSYRRKTKMVAVDVDCIRTSI